MALDVGCSPRHAPLWLQHIDEARRSRAAGVVLTYNTADRVLLGDSMPLVTSLKFALARQFREEGFSICSYSVGLGPQELDPPGASAPPVAGVFRQVPDHADPNVVLSQLGRLLKSHGQDSARLLVIVDYAEHLLPGHQGGMHLSLEQTRGLELVHSWGQDDNLKASGHFVILVSYENRVSTLLTQNGGFREVRVDLPTEVERRHFIEYLLGTRESQPHAIGTLDDDLGVALLARLTGGLRLIDIEELLRASGAQGQPVTKASVREFKKRAISVIGQDLVEVIDPEDGFDQVAGSEHAKRYFELIRQPWMRGAPGVPQGVLLAGVPGCGKSYLVQAVAREFQAPLLVMRNVRESWVGASERNLERVLWIAENLSPCIIWTDEVDQVIGHRGTGSSGDSGTNDRILARIFEFFGSMRHRGRILWIATTNRPDALDPALLDRFQVVIPFLHPSASERRQLIPLLARQIGRELAPDVDPAEIAAFPRVSGLTVRSLQEVMVFASLQTDAARGETGGPISRTGLVAAIAEHRTAFNPTEHEYIALTALQMTSFKSLLPWWRPGGGTVDPMEWPPYMSRVIAGDTGELDEGKLTDRLEALRATRHMDRVLQ